MRRRKLRIASFALIQALYSGNARRDDPRYGFALGLVLDYEMTEHFGGPVGGADAVPEVEFQRHMLCFQAKLAAQNAAVEKASHPTA